MSKRYDFSKLQGKMVSILIVGKNQKNETFKGIIEGIEGDFIILNTDWGQSDFPLSQVLIRTSMVQSVWVYREKGVCTP